MHKIYSDLNGRIARRDLNKEIDTNYNKLKIGQTTEYLLFNIK